MSSLNRDSAATLAADLGKQSEQDGVVTPMDAVLDAGRAGILTDDQRFRFLGRLWTPKRIMYYVYGGWAQGINLNEYPPSVAYLFGKQIYALTPAHQKPIALCREVCPEGAVHP
jgi:hypothetical protein